MEQYQTHLTDSANNTSRFTSSTKKAGPVLKSFGASLASMGVNMAIGMAIEGAITLADKLAESLDEQKEKLEKTKSSISDYEGQISNLESKISENENKIEEINSNPLDIVDKNTLSSLQDENAQLNQQLELIKAINEDAKDLAENTTVQILENTAKITGLTESLNALQSGDILGAFSATDNGLGGLINSFNKFSDGDIWGGIKSAWSGISTSSGNVPLMLYNWFNPHKENEQSPTEEALSQINEIKQLYDDLNNTKDEKDKSNIQSDINKKTTSLLTNIKTLKSYKDTLDETDPEQAKWIQEIQKIEDAYIAMQAKKQEYNSFDEIINSDTYGKDKDKLIDLAKQGMLTSDVIEKDYHNLFVLFDAIGLSTDDVIEHLKQMGKQAEHTNEISSANPKSFTEVWGSIGTTGTDEENKAIEEEKQRLKELAEAGKLTKEELSNSPLADEFEKTGISIDQATQKINGLVENSKQLDAMKTGISAITSAYSEKNDSEEHTVSTSTLGSMYDTLGIAEWDEENKKVWENYKKYATDGKKSMADTKKAQDELAKAYINSNNFLANLDETNKGYYKTLLKQMGVTNANEVVTNSLRESAVQSYNAQDADKKHKKSLDALGKELKNATKKEKEYYFAELVSNNSNLETEESIQNLINLANQLELDKFWVTELGAEIDKLQDKTVTVKVNTVIGNTTGGTSDYKNPGNFGVKKKSGSLGTKTNDYFAKGAITTPTQSKELALAERKAKDNTSVKPKVNTSTNSNKTDNTNKNKNKEAKTAIDWLSRRLTRMQSIIDLTASKLQNLFSAKAKKSNLNKQIKQTEKLATQYGIAAKKYQDKADSVAKGNKKKKVKPLSKDIITQIQSGKITKKSYPKLIKAYGQSDADRINKYIDYYDKAQDAKKSKQEQKAKALQLKKDRLQVDVDDYNAKATLAETRADNAKGYKDKNKYIKQQISYLNESYKKQKEIAKLSGDKTEQARLQAEYEAKVVELQQQQIDNLKTEYENRIGLIGNGQQDIDNQLAKMEARGQIVQSSYYSDLNNKENQKIATLNEELAELLSRQNTFDEGTQEWYDLQSDIQSVENSINDAEIAIIENNKKIGELRQAMYDDIAARNSNISTESDFLAGLLGDNLTDDKTGNLTKEGLAALGTYGIDMSANARTAQSRKEQREEIENDIASYKNGNSNALDSYGSLDAAEKKLAEVIQQQQEAISAEYANEKQIYDLMTQRYETQLSYLKSIIDAKKQTLDLEKDLYDYQKNIANQTKNIATLEKQLAALQGDDSEEGRARRAKLQLQLDEANQDLQDTEYERYISDQQNMLDNLYSQYEDLIKELEKDFDAVVNDGVNLICEKSDEISATLTNLATEYGYNPSNDMQGILDALSLSNNENNPVIKTLPEEIKTGLSGLGNIVQGYTEEVKKAYGSGSGSGNGGGGSGDGENNDGGHGDRGQSGSEQAHQLELESVRSFMSTRLQKPKKKRSEYQYVNQKIYDATGKVLSTDNLKALAKKLGVTYDNSSENGNLAKRLKEIGYTGFHTGGIVRANGVPKDGDYVPVRVNPNETILTQKFTDMLPNAVDIMENFTKAMNLPDYPKAIPNNIGNSQSFGDIVINAELPNVENVQDFVSALQTDRKVQQAFTIATKDLVTKGRITNSIQNIV